MTTLEQQIEVLKKYRQLDKAGQEYICNLPSEFRELIICNAYSESLTSIITLLQKGVFGEMNEEFSWFLFEFKENENRTEPNIKTQKKEYVIRTDEDYYDYLLEEYI